MAKEYWIHKDEDAARYQEHIPDDNLKQYFYRTIDYSEYEKLLIALQDIANTRPHKESALEMKKIAKKALGKL